MRVKLLKVSHAVRTHRKMQIMDHIPLSIPPSTFYENPPTTGSLHSPITSVTTPPAQTAQTRCKGHTEFSLKDLDHLLSAVMQINPFMAPHKKIGEKWKEVAKQVQGEGFCLNREPETLKNKVGSLLAWVEVS